MIVLDPGGPVPPYEQIRSQLADQIEHERLRAGDRLPTVRRLAEDLGVATNTVARAYRELETAGLIETRGRAGSFVAGSGVEREAREAARLYVERVRALGLEDRASLQLITRLLGPRGPATQE
ncbi:MULTISPECIES: GntR family transcriptional regulator [Pimelobacter]|uniref:GntR family transcriptional regulator n=1 Tax=Pimelobacter TaxID=2044 RepID=UPI001C03E8B0|nr:MULTISPECIES: GntR family transcriptional regulator [Pimelobacter]MBU2694200.1 GntR family transcriptional regulator [Pimelobacter sp. 30-1]UUW90275.1 GntR family transcriptional regulator [Pimelobacter simplex]UUW94104.1 GntR family transcriptional regulator [Pimelobacter simplex]